MKNIKFILFLCLSATLFISCGNDDDAPAFTLTNANIAGTYEISSAESTEKETATSSNGNVVTLSTTKNVADSFTNINFIISANGTYTASGGYRVVSTITPTGGSPTEASVVLNFEGAGSYVINTSNNTITFNETSGDFIDGEFKVVTFTTNVVNLTQSDVDVNGSNTITTDTKLGLKRK